MINKRLYFILLLLCGTTVCMETDIYVPSMPDMLIFFGATEEKLELLLSLNFFGLCISGLLYGPLSDAYGRRPLSLIGLAIFLIGSIGCVFTSDIDWMIFHRLIQGLGGGAIFSVMVASIYDFTSKEESARYLGYVASFVTTMMAGAPIVGSWINIGFGWRANFILIAILNAISLITCVFLLQETLKQENRNKFSMPSLFKNYGKLLGNFKFMANTLAFSFTYSCIILYIANLSLIFVNHLGVPESHYGWYQLPIMGVYTFFSFVMSKKVTDWGLDYSQRLGEWVLYTGTVLLTVIAIFKPDSPIAITIAMVIYAAGAPFIMTPCYTKAVTLFPTLNGAANSMSASMRLLISGLLVGYSGHLFNGSILPIALIIAFTSIVSFCMLLGVKRKEAAQPTTA